MASQISMVAAKYQVRAITSDQFIVIYTRGSEMESSAVRVLVALVKAERKRVAALENVAEFLKKRKEQSDALFTQAKEEMEEAKNKLAEAEEARRLLLSNTVVNKKFPS